MSNFLKNSTLNLLRNTIDYLLIFGTACHRLVLIDINITGTICSLNNLLISCILINRFGLRKLKTIRSVLNFWTKISIHFLPVDNYTSSYVSSGETPAIRYVENADGTISMQSPTSISGTSSISATCSTSTRQQLHQLQASISDTERDLNSTLSGIQNYLQRQVRRESKVCG